MITIKKKILLTGATGTVGKEVLNQLIQLNCYDVFITIRKKNIRKKELKKISTKAQVIDCDLSKAEDVFKINDQYDGVIHLAAVIPPLADEQPSLAKAVNTNGTINLINQLEKVSPNAFFMYSSSISVYGDRITSPNIKVSDPLQVSLGDEYAVTKIDAEKALMNSSLSWTIFRLSAIMGVKNHKMSGLMFHMPLETSMEICTPSDTARAFVNGLKKKNELNHRIFNLAGGEKCRITYEKFLEENFKMNGLGKLNFPPKTFAEKNFHCGFYADGQELEEITKFRNDTLQDYFNMNKKSIPLIQKKATYLLKGIIKYFIKKQSEPLKAYLSKDKKLMKRFFK